MEAYIQLLSKIAPPVFGGSCEAVADINNIRHKGFHPILETSIVAYSPNHGQLDMHCAPALSGCHVSRCCLNRTSRLNLLFQA